MSQALATLVTGSTGFIGGALTLEMRRRGLSVRTATRCSEPGEQNFVVGKIGPDTDWSSALKGCGCVVHLAARVHVMKDDAADPLNEYRHVNVLGTLNLARQAALTGVRRFVYLSSIKVHGEGKTLPYRPADILAPSDPYGVSKMEAEQGLRELAANTGMEVVIVRPPLVYGPGVRANFKSMMGWLITGVPLPFGAVHNQRSLVALDNLVDLLVTCIRHPNAANQTFLVSDGEDLSTTQLLQRMAHALGRRARLLPVPAWVIEAGAAMLGKRALSQRLCGSLQVDISKTRDLLGWTPPISVDEGLRRTARHFLA